MTTLVVRPDHAHERRSNGPHWLPPAPPVPHVSARQSTLGTSVAVKHPRRPAPTCARCLPASKTEQGSRRRSLLEPQRRCSRRGTTAVEVAVVLPVFFVFVWGLIEFGHAFMVVNLLNAAAKRAAREGVVDDVSTSQVVARVREIVGSAVDTQSLSVHVKDASVFDQANPDVAHIDYQSLPDVELDDLEPRQLFVVYLEIPYTNVAILPPKWVTNVTLKGQSVQRHE